MATAAASRATLKEFVFEWEGKDRNGKVVRGEIRAAVGVRGGGHRVNGRRMPLLSRLPRRGHRVAGYRHVGPLGDQPTLTDR